MNAKDLKIKTENKIKEALKEFNNKTGLEISSVWVSKPREIGFISKTEEMQVSINVN